jgi:2-polyprenyl-3-methyl-5-hydroxy-6-metoxy-1,4-benzoquinol methylase
VSYAKKIYDNLTHFFGRVTKKYYFEDHVRVYPDGLRFDQLGRKIVPSENDVKNYNNHRKFYEFVAQFVVGKKVGDIGCGSGYGCEILKQSGAAKVCGADISRSSIRFASSRYKNIAEFTVQGITDLKDYPEDFFDITVCSEVMEHIKEYGMERRAIRELKRITRHDGLIVIATPNSEMLDDHGFSYDEMKALLEDSFSEFCIFENALLPYGDKKEIFLRRKNAGKVGILVSEAIVLSDVVLPEGVTPELKEGIKPDAFAFSRFDVDVTLLHNTHSWIILAVNEKPDGK